MKFKPAGHLGSLVKPVEHAGHLGSLVKPVEDAGHLRSLVKPVEHAVHLGSLFLSKIYIAGYSSRDQESKYAMLFFS